MMIIKIMKSKSELLEYQLNLIYISETYRKIEIKIDNVPYVAVKCIYI